MTLELLIRLGCFISVLLLMFSWERWQPKRTPTVTKSRRWLHNFSLLALATLLVRLLIPAGAVGAALWAESQAIGLWQWLNVPFWLGFIGSLVVLDVTIYWQHRAFHALPWLWRLHRVHHADPDFDASTGLRFHPLEIILSMLLKMAVVVLIGAPVWAVIVFEIVLNATSLFNHGNVALPRWLERPVRYLLVTQEMHRIHHSQIEAETNSNYSFNLSIWDRLFNSYTDQPAAGSDGIQIGLSDYPNPQQTTGLVGMLTIPFVNPQRPLQGNDKVR